MASDFGSYSASSGSAARIHRQIRFGTTSKSKGTSASESDTGDAASIDSADSRVPSSTKLSSNQRPPHLEKNQQSQSERYAKKIDDILTLPEPTPLGCFSCCCPGPSKTSQLLYKVVTEGIPLKKNVLGNFEGSTNLKNIVKRVETLLANFHRDYSPIVDQETLDAMIPKLRESIVAQFLIEQSDEFCHCIFSNTAYKVVRGGDLTKHDLVYLSYINTRGIDWNRSKINSLFQEFCCSTNDDKTWYKLIALLSCFSIDSRDELLRQQFDIFSLTDFFIRKSRPEYTPDPAFTKRVAMKFFKDDFNQKDANGDTPALKFMKQARNNIQDADSDDFIFNHLEACLGRIKKEAEFFFDPLFINDEILNAQDSDGNTLLHYATFDESIYKLLLEKGVDPTRKNNAGVSPKAKYREDAQLRQTIVEKRRKVAAALRNLENITQRARENDRYSTPPASVDPHPNATARANHFFATGTYDWGVSAANPY